MITFFYLLLSFYFLYIYFTYIFYIYIYTFLIWKASPRFFYSKELSTLKMELNCQNILYRLLWEIFMFIFTIFALLITPIFLAFYFDAVEKWYIYNMVIDIIFLCDIVIFFFTGYYDPKTQLIIMTPKYVMRYAKIAYDYK